MQTAPLIAAPVICGCLVSASVLLSRVDLPRLNDWKGIDLDGSGVPIVWLNAYRCECGETWEMEWSCQCGDRCPGCDAECDAADSGWIGPEGGETLWYKLPELPEDAIVNEPIRCRCGWSGLESDLIEGANSQDGVQSDCLCPACCSDHFLSGFDAAVDPL